MGTRGHKPAGLMYMCNMRVKDAYVQHADTGKQDWAGREVAGESQLLGVWGYLTETKVIKLK